MESDRLALPASGPFPRLPSRPGPYRPCRNRTSPGQPSSVHTSQLQLHPKGRFCALLFLLRTEWTDSATNCLFALLPNWQHFTTSEGDISTRNVVNQTLPHRTKLCRSPPDSAWGGRDLRDLVPLCAVTVVSGRHRVTIKVAHRRCRRFPGRPCEFPPSLETVPCAGPTNSLPLRRREFVATL